MAVTADRTSMGILAAVALAAVAGCGGPGPTSTNTPREMFEAVLMSPVVGGVSDLQGVGDTWQGYSLYLRFTATSDCIDSLIATGYRDVYWSDIEEEFDLPAGYDRFDPDWAPGAICDKDCYFDEVENSWTHSGTHWLVVDRESGTVYFRGLGA